MTNISPVTSEIRIQGKLLNSYRTLVNPGWNYISYKGVDTILVNDLFSLVDSSDGDKIISLLNPGAQYYSAVNLWFPDNFTINKGIGYRYYNNTNQTKYINML